MRTDLKIRRIIETIGYGSFIVGLFGLAGTIETGYGFLPSAIMFGIGVGTSLFFINR